jgi:dTDP-4-dehydrorhamnose 3,5-epimerase
MIKDVVLKDLVVHKDERGKLFEILRSDDEIFSRFGQAYITVCYKGWVKGWHYHKNQKDYFCIIYGKAKVVLFDNRKESPTYNTVDEYILDYENPKLLVIPEKVVHGFECISDTECYILNIPTRPYNRDNPDEYRYKLDSPEIPYEPWKNRKGW